MAAARTPSAGLVHGVGNPVSLERIADGDALSRRLAVGLGTLGALLGQGSQLLVHEEHDADVRGHVEKVSRDALVETT